MFGAGCLHVFARFFSADITFFLRGEAVAPRIPCLVGFEQGARLGRAQQLYQREGEHVRGQEHPVRGSGVAVTERKGEHELRRAARLPGLAVRRDTLHGGGQGRDELLLTAVCGAVAAKPEQPVHRTPAARGRAHALKVGGVGGGNALRYAHQAKGFSVG